MTCEHNRLSAVRLAFGARLTMLLTPTRVAYLGLLGTPATRFFGSIVVYQAFDGSKVAVRYGSGGWETGDIAIVPPYVAHQVRSESRLVICVMIEAESVDVAAALQHLRQSAAALAGRIGCAARDLQGLAADEAYPRAQFDTAFFGSPLPPRILDPRIASIVEVIRRNPTGTFPIPRCAAGCGLSGSRLTHLFKAETGATFRLFRAWKRARHFLLYANTQCSATEVAMNAGYPDLTHFSHSIRRFYGQKPKDIFEGSRRLVVITKEKERQPGKEAVLS